LQALALNKYNFKNTLSQYMDTSEQNNQHDEEEDLVAPVEGEEHKNLEETQDKPIFYECDENYESF
jgi:hypothetical protein